MGNDCKGCEHGAYYDTWDGTRTCLVCGHIEALTVNTKEHVEHINIPDAQFFDCFEGDCEHLDDNGEHSDWNACPTFEMEVCVDCMDIKGHGRDPATWEEGLVKWPCETSPQIFKKRVS